MNIRIYNHNENDNSLGQFFMSLIQVGKFKVVQGMATISISQNTKYHAYHSLTTLVLSLCKFTQPYYAILGNLL